MNAPTYSFDTEHSEDGVQVLPQASDNGRLRSGRSDDSEGDLRAFLNAPERPAANCCTRPVAAAFLLCVAVALVVTWQVLPLEDLVASYLPQFDEPTVPYTGKEAGTLDAPLSGGAADDGGAGEDDGGDEGDGDEVVVELPPDNAERPGTSVPEFMACPTGGGRRCCNGAVDNCGLRVDQMLFGMVHNAMSSEGEAMTWSTATKLSNCARSLVSLACFVIERCAALTCCRTRGGLFLRVQPQAAAGAGAGRRLPRAEPGRVRLRRRPAILPQHLQ